MTLDEFVSAFAAEFDETPEDQFTAETAYKELEEWGSLVALSIISMIDDEFEKTVTGADIRSCNTIKELFELVEAK
jgi:acyl carrier protein